MKHVFVTEMTGVKPLIIMSIAGESLMILDAMLDEVCRTLSPKDHLFTCEIQLNCVSMQKLLHWPEQISSLDVYLSVRHCSAETAIKMKRVFTVLFIRFLSPSLSSGFL